MTPATIHSYDGMILQVSNPPSSHEGFTQSSLFPHLPGEGC